LTEVHHFVQCSYVREIRKSASLLMGVFDA
jgi:hypothetical protein